MKPMMWVVVALTSVLAAGIAAAGTRDEVLQRGYLQCGVSTGVPGFSHPDDKGNWVGLDVDLCRAVAAATLGDASKVKYIPLNSRECFTALQSGEIDLLSRGSTYTLTRDSSLDSTSPASPTMTARVFWSQKNPASKMPPTSKEPRSASWPARPARPTSPPISGSTTWSSGP